MDGGGGGHRTPLTHSAPDGAHALSFHKLSPIVLERWQAASSPLQGLPVFHPTAVHVAVRHAEEEARQIRTEIEVVEEEIARHRLKGLDLSSRIISVPMTRLHALASTSSTSETELLKVLELQPAAVTEVDDRGYNALHYLARYHGHRQRVIDMACTGDEGAAAARSPHVGSADRSGVLPLHILCRYHAREETSVKRMLAAFPDAVQHSDHRGCLPLHFACAAGASSAVIAALLNHYPQAAAKEDDEAYLPLHYLTRTICHHDDLDSLRVMIEANSVALTRPTRTGLLPLDCLAQNEHATEKMVRVLLDSKDKYAGGF